MSKFKQIFIPAVSLFIICAVIAAALSLTDYVTKSTIEQAQKNALTQSLRSSVPEADSFEESEASGSVYYIAKKNGNTAAYVFETSAKGYGGDITVLTAIDNDGKILKVTVSDASGETTGIGSKVVSDDGFLSQFCGGDHPFSLGENADAITGATYSSRGVTEAVNSAAALFDNISRQGGTENE